MSVKVKICGVRRREDALCAAAAGADLIGLNFWPGTPRCVSVEAAREIAEAVRRRVQIVALFVDAPGDEVLATAEAVGADYVQLHGAESAEFVRGLGERRVIKAFRVESPPDVDRLAGFPAEVYLLDARVRGMKGGTGRTIDWELARKAAAHGRILLAGGLTAENVAEAVRIARPWGVDTASGVELEPGVKDPDKIRRFVDNAKACEEEP
ncbi:MAG: phosphoribosylanthranilate isomerase [Planctomycetota bacterium]